MGAGHRQQHRDARRGSRHRGGGRHGHDVTAGRRIPRYGTPQHDRGYSRRRLPPLPSQLGRRAAVHGFDVASLGAAGFLCLAALAVFLITGPTHAPETPDQPQYRCTPVRADDQTCRRWTPSSEVRILAIGRHRRSATRCSLVDTPPRDRPSASSVQDPLPGPVQRPAPMPVVDRLPSHNTPTGNADVGCLMGQVGQKRVAEVGAASGLRRSRVLGTIGITH